jgi:hypothetical protein
MSELNIAIVPVHQYDKFEVPSNNFFQVIEQKH